MWWELRGDRMSTGGKVLYMHNVIAAACRRSGGLAAGLVLGAGLAGSVWLTPGTALAGTTVATTTAITGTTQSPGHHHTTLNVQVSVTPASGTVWPSGIVKVSDGPGGCQLTLVQDGTTAAGVGNCDIYDLQGGTYTLTAAYEGSSSFGSSASGPDTVTVGPTPVTRHHVAIAANLSCPSKVYAGQQGSCTLSVTNPGRFSAPDVTAQVSLPPQLRAQYCGRFWPHRGCTISGNTASENLGTLRPGQTRTLTVAFVAKSGHGIWGGHRFQTIKVKVAGSAASDGGLRGSGGRSYSTAYVTIVPRGWWSAF
jgi:Bacterial Ig-like domain (group 3)